MKILLIQLHTARSTYGASFRPTATMPCAGLALRQRINKAPAPLYSAQILKIASSVVYTPS